MLNLLDYTPHEMMTITASRYVLNNITLFVGIGLPSVASNLARVTHAPNTTLIYESGTIGAKPTVLPLSIGDEELAETADSIVSVPDIFRYWLQAGRVDLGFLGAAQIDRYGNLNTTVIGNYDHPDVRLPGAGGAPEIATLAKEVLIVMKQSKRSFVENLDFISSPGNVVFEKNEHSQKNLGQGVKAIITDLGVLTPSETGEFMLTSIYPEVTLDQVLDNTGWDLKVASQLKSVQPPSETELTKLREF